MITAPWQEMASYLKSYHAHECPADQTKLREVFLAAFLIGYISSQLSSASESKSLVALGKQLTDLGKDQKNGMATILEGLNALEEGIDVVTETLNGVAETQAKANADLQAELNELQAKINALGPMDPSIQASFERMSQKLASARTLSADIRKLAETTDSLKPSNAQVDPADTTSSGGDTGPQRPS